MHLSRRARMLLRIGTFITMAFLYVPLLVILLFGKGIGVLVGLPIVDTGVYTPLRDNPIAWFGYLLVPWMITGAPLAAICLRLTASGMRDQDDADFVRTASGKGLSGRRVAFRHSLPASAAPTISARPRRRRPTG